MSVPGNFETCLGYWGYLLAVNSQIYVKTSSLKRANNVPKLPGVDYVAKNRALSMMLKALQLVHFWSVLLKEQMMTSVRKTLKTLVWSAQNQLISSEICPENNHKIRCFFTNRFPAKFAPKIPTKFPRYWPLFPQFCPWKSREIWLFFPRPIRSPIKRQCQKLNDQQWKWSHLNHVNGDEICIQKGIFSS